MDRRNLQDLTDEELARDARAGSAVCFEELVRRYQVPLLRFLLRRSPSPRDAEDVLQDSFLRAYQALDQYQDGYAFKTWLFTISYRVAISGARRLKLATESAPELQSPSERPDEQIEREESRSRLWDLARRTLTEEQFSALWLHYVDAMPAKDIGKVIGRSWVWVKTALHRSRGKLRNAMEHSQTPADLAPVARGEL